VRVKICGITNYKDAMDAIDAGADALGFVFYTKSTRYIEPIEAKKIIEQLPAFVQIIGLFVNETSLNIDTICTIAKVDIAQIHFEASEDFYQEVKTKTLRVVRAKRKEDIKIFANEYRIVDAFVETYGGEGKRLELNWFKDIDCSKIIIAGGLTPNNVEELKGYNFYSLDVSSGVEYTKGIKDKQKMIEFITAANELSV
jgi:phosphoribosylanthranilate isomerase